MKGMVHINKISVVIVTWNNEDVIAGCLDSFVRFIKEDTVELILVDNNSKDKTCEIIRTYEDRLTIKLFQLNENLGFSKANNFGVANASYDDILLLNPDTLLIEEGLEALPKYLEKTNTGIVGVRLLNSDRSLQPSMFNFDNVFNIIGEQFLLGKILPEKVRKRLFPYLSKHNKPQNTDWVIGAFMLITKTDFKTIGGFSEDYFMYSEDMDICYKMEEVLNKRVLFVPDYSIIHIGGTSEKKDFNSTKQEKMFLSRKLFADKYGYKWNMKTFLICYRFKFIMSNLINDDKKKSYYRNTIDNLTNILDMGR